MTRVLAIDTSTRRGSVALVERHQEQVRTVAAHDETMAESHAVHLFDLIDRVMQEAGWKKSELDGFAVVRGPGSFTGVRIALGTAHGLALASSRPCVGVNTLEALAEASGPCPRERVVLLGAGRGELYGARYDARQSPPVELEAPWLRPADEVWATLNGYALWGADAEPSAEEPRRDGRAAGTGTAAAAGRIALLRGLRQTDSSDVSPLYIRVPDAELNRRKR